MRLIVSAFAVAMLAGSALAQVPGPPPAPNARPPVTPEIAEMMRVDAAARVRTSLLPDNPGTGRFAALKEVDPRLARHVIYRPAKLAALGNTKLGVVVWGNGGCAADAAGARFHLLEIASHGYLVIAPGDVLSGPGAPPAAPRAEGILGVKTTTADVLAGLDWALAENSRKGSPYFGRIDPKLTAVSGHSCGGLQAIQAAGDPRIHAVVIHNSGVFADGSNPIGGITVDKLLLRTFHTPILYILGGPRDVAYPNGTDDFAKIDTVPAMLLNLEVGHGGTFREPNGGRVAQVAVAWLDWQLRGDKVAARNFTGPDCTLCVDPQWKVERKRIG